MLTTEDIESVFNANDDHLPPAELEKKQKLEDDEIPSECFSSDDESSLLLFFKIRKMKHKTSTDAFKELKKKEDELLNSGAVGEINSEHLDVAPANLEECKTNSAEKHCQDTMDLDVPSSSGCGSCSKHDNSSSENIKYDEMKCRDAMKRTKDLFQQLLDTPCETNDDVIDVPNTYKLIGDTSENVQENIYENKIMKKLRFLNRVISLTERKQMKRKIFTELLEEKKRRLEKNDC